MTTEVKYFHSAMTGAPVLSGTAGAMIAVLDACLVNGFGLKTVDTLIVSGGLATASISTGHSADTDTVVLISGATPAGLNGEKRVISRTTNTVVFDATGISDQTATGTITLKLAPAGWQKQFSGTNLAAYRSQVSTATKFPMRVDDTGTTDARVTGYESMTDINTGDAPFPTAAQRSGGVYWPKSRDASATARPWVLIADGSMVYLHVDYDHSSFPDVGFTVCFGDFVPVYSGDTFNCILSGHSATFNSSFPSNSSTSLMFVSSSGAPNETWIARSYAGAGSSTRGLRQYDQPFVLAVDGISGGSARNIITYPNPMDGSLMLAVLRVFEAATFGMRGVFPGFYATPQRITDGTFATKDPVTGVTGLSGRTLRTLVGYYQSGTNGKVFVDTTGPWR